jgi:hypothetical protein
MEVSVFDQLAAQHAAGRHIAFNDVHAKLRSWLIPAITAVARHMGPLGEALALQLLQAGANVERATERVSAISPAFSVRSERTSGRGFAPWYGLCPSSGRIEAAGHDQNDEIALSGH